MAKAKKAPAKSSGETKITRIKAADSQSKPAKKTNQKTAVSVKKAEPKATEKKAPKMKKPAKETKKRGNIFKRMGTYFRGAWAELRKVRWPSNAATWRMTGALILFVLVFAVFIVLLDVLFQYLFTLAIG